MDNIPCENTENVSINKEPTQNYGFLDFFQTLAKGLIIVLIITAFVFELCTVVGTSMMGTLEDGDRLLISNLFYEPEQFDIVVFHHLGNLNEPLVKRIIATENQWIRIDTIKGKIYVSDDSIIDENDLIDESDYVYLDSGYYRQYYNETLQVPEGHVFVLGDNRNNSLDSRSDEIGFVDKRTIIGKVIFRISGKSFGIVQ